MQAPVPKSTGSYNEQQLETFIDTYFNVIGRYGILGSINDFIPVMNESESEVYRGLRQYYNNELTGAIMSPLFPDQCIYNVWVLKRKTAV